MPIRRSLRQLVGSVLIRRLVLVGFDGLLILVCFYGAFALRLPEKESLAIAIGSLHYLPWLAVFTGVPVLLFSGWYRGLTRYAGSHSLYGLIPRALLMVLVLLLANTMIGGSQPPRSFWILYWLLFSGLAISSRILLRDLLVSQLDRRGRSPQQIEANATLIYGAGYTGMNLFQALRNDQRFRIVGFLDDDSNLHGRTLQNRKIYNPQQLATLSSHYGVRKVLLALPSLPRERKRLLVDQLTRLNLEVLSIPSLAELASGKRIVSDIQPILIEDLLGREPSRPDQHLLEASVKQKSVLVTGAGGSIGSELCRQIVTLEASILLLLDQSEFALYQIERELTVSSSATRVVPILGDCSDAARLARLCEDYGVETIFHAAAYKHVPMVEANLCAGVANNLHATQAVIHAARSAGVERLTLISTDKAVRPTNAMGASKRVCELLIQAAAADASLESGDVLASQRRPIMAMVRFGNVLGSSGSVIPLFHDQIARGGPITVTHPSITRYFMTIPEAVQLVLQATGMARGGDLFLLDMGEPVRIADLARQMIELSGLRVKDEQNPNGDIAIQYTGLRPGEKLYEELLISAKDQVTQHPLIRRAKEPKRSWRELKPLIDQLEQALQHWDEEQTLEILSRLVPEYHPQVQLPQSLSMGPIRTASHP